MAIRQALRYDRRLIAGEPPDVFIKAWAHDATKYLGSSADTYVPIACVSRLSENRHPRRHHYRLYPNRLCPKTARS